MEVDDTSRCAEAVRAPSDGVGFATMLRLTSSETWAEGWTWTKGWIEGWGGVEGPPGLVGMTKGLGSSTEEG